MTRRLHDAQRRAAAAVLAICVGTLAAPSDELPDASVRAGVRMPEPRVRIALGSGGEEIRIAARGGGYAVLGGGGRQRVLDVPDGAPRRAVAAGRRAGSGGRLHAVQVGSFRDEAAARRLAAELEREHGVPAQVKWQASRQVFRVRVGRSRTSGGLAELLRALRATGYPDAWIVSEAIDVLPDGRIRLFDTAWEAIDAPGRSVIVVPGPRATLTVADRPYRGLVELTIAADGRLLAINELPLEEYLRGVVPEELGPAAFPELEALKAQAVAARTYIVANLGQFAEEGYDICDTPRCQVYGGAASEHPLSDRAVRETRGLVLLRDGMPVNAMYTSTCGGHTEDIEVVFPDMTGEHLRGVPCRPEREELERRRIALSGREVPQGDAAGHASPRVLELARLVAAGIVPRGALDAAWARAPLAAPELGQALARVAQLAGKVAPAVDGARWTRLAAWRALAALLDDAGSGHGLVERPAVPLVLAYPDAPDVPERDRPALAALLAGGVVRPRADGRLDPGGVPARDEALGWLARLAERFAIAELRRADVRGARRGRLLVRERRTERSLPLAPAPDLLVEEAGAWRRVDAVELWPGDDILFAEGEGERGRGLSLVAVRARASLSDDRDSSRFRWERARSRREIERGLAGVAPVGVLQGLRVLSRGVSGRVAELEVVGSSGRAVVRGFRLRRALGLPETLFDLDVQREPDGPLRRVTFRGRGWGHGVGLCQYGAYGMAKRGADYREILTHYYAGVSVRRARAGR